MKYNTHYLDIKYALINAFLVNADKALLDISYEFEEDKIKVQVVLIDGSNRDYSFKEKVKEHFSNWQVEVNVLFISKEKFNENKGDWNPKYYKWLKYLLFSKAEVL
jgi:hypothetical protein